MSTSAAEPQKTTAERALGAVPVVLTVLATILAGLSSSEMTQSMYYRSLAGQNQAKAGSQWGFFQAKRIRGTTMESGRDLVRTLVDPMPLDAAQLRAAGERVEAAVRRAGDTPEVKAAVERISEDRKKLDEVASRESVSQSLRYLFGAEPPAVAEQHVDDKPLRDLLKAIENRETESKTAERVMQIPEARVDEALDVAEANAAAFDEACKPVTGDIRALETAFADLAATVRKLRAGPQPSPASAAALDEASNVVKETLTGLRAAKQDFTARRYAKEAAYNQESAELLEVLARRNGAESDRHRHRSKNFFYAMLCAQAGVTIASFALARSRKSWFWGVAGMAGILAVIFGGYVYLAL
jgi:hypothetical protein